MSFEKKVGNFIREGSDTQRPGRARVIQGGNDELAGPLTAAAREALGRR